MGTSKICHAFTSSIKAIFVVKHHTPIKASSCIVSCPCMENCPSGCQNCTTAFCSCRDYESNPDYITCSDQYELLYTRCLLGTVYSNYLKQHLFWHSDKTTHKGCPHQDIDCLAQCSRDYDENIENCPCRANCPTGCPCPGFQCSSTTTQITNTTTTQLTTTTTPGKPKTAVLILHSKPGNVPIITDFNGRDDRNFRFNYGEDTTVYMSCSVTFQNEFYVFGGGSTSTNKRQIRSCFIQRITELLQPILVVHNEPFFSYSR